MRTKLFFQFTAILCFVAFSCKKDSPIKTEANAEKVFAESSSASTVNQTTYYGPAVTFNNSQIMSYFTAYTPVSMRAEDMIPIEIGYVLNDAIFNSLPNPNAVESQQILLTLPSVAKQYTVFDHLTFQWNPNGHDPLFAFGSPHFDFHFYQIPVNERLLIDMNDPAIMIAPPAEFIPANYFGPTGPMSQMGNHWVDLLSPEFNGGTFTKTFIYGSNNGKVIFEEPMITLAQLLSPTAELPIRQPAAYQRAGYYPTTYGVKKSGGKTYVYLRNFVHQPSGAQAL